MKYKLILSDVDGTLVNEVQQLSVETINAVKEYQAKGGRFAIASGRIEKATIGFCETLNITTPCILYNGSKVVDVLANKCVYEKSLNPYQLEAILAIIPSFNVDVIVYAKAEAYIIKRNAVLETYMKKDGIQCHEIQEFSSLESVTKIMMIGEGQNKEAFGIALKKQMGEVNKMPELVQSEATYLEILPTGVSKGEALLALTAYLGLNMDHVVAIGDNLNDLEMIECAGLGVAVENAHPLVLEMADYKTGSNVDHGVAELIRLILANKI